MLERHVAVDQAMVRIHHFIIVRERLRLIALSDGRRLQGALRASIRRRRSTPASSISYRFRMRVRGTWR